MAQIFSINEAQTLISNLLDEVWEAEKPSKQVAFEQFMNVSDMSRGEHVDYPVSGFGRFVERDELEDIDYDGFDFGTSLTVKPKNWARGFLVSEEVVEDLADAGTNDGINRAKLGSYADAVRRWKRSATWTVEQECADLITNGTSTATGYALRDGNALLGSHTTLKNPTTTQSTLSTHASLSANQIMTMQTSLNTQLDDRGDYIGDGDGDILLVGPTNDFRSHEILATKGQVDTMNNNVNPLNGRDITIVVDKYLGATWAGYWLLRKGIHSLNWLWRVKPQFKQDSDFDAIAMKFRARFRGVRYAKDWRGVVGDNGS